MGFEQRDSHEAVQFLLDILHEEIAQPIDIEVTVEPELGEFFKICDQFYNTEGKKDKSLLKIIDSNNEKTLDYFAMKYYDKLSKSYSEISDIFESITCNLLKCPDCNHMRYNFDKHYIMSLSLPEVDDEKIKKLDAYTTMVAEKTEELKHRTDDVEIISKLCLNELRNKYIYKLDDLLENYQKPEELDKDNLWECENCEKKVHGLKQIKLYKNPKYLFIHFKRFKHLTINGNTIIVKLKNLIGYNEFIDIGDLMIKAGSNTKYQIMGGINHMGEYSHGHFTCFAKNNNKWYNYNDDTVNELHCSGIPLTQNAYMLIYKRVDEEI